MARSWKAAGSAWMWSVAALSLGGEQPRHMHPVTSVYLPSWLSHESAGLTMWSAGMQLQWSAVSSQAAAATCLRGLTVVAPWCRQPKRLGGGKGGESRAWREPKKASKRISAGLPPTVTPGSLAAPAPPRSTLSQACSSPAECLVAAHFVKL